MRTVDRPEVVVLGGEGNIGSAVVAMLADGDWCNVTVGDQSINSNAPVETNVRRVIVDCGNKQQLVELLRNKDLVLTTLPCQVNGVELNRNVAEAALATGRTKYQDPTESVTHVAHLEEISQQASPDQVFVPSTGLAPGVSSILARNLIHQFEKKFATKPKNVRVRVGALPQKVEPDMYYGLTWSPEGVAREYVEDCYALVDGLIVRTDPLDGPESYTVDGRELEARTTSGGIGSLYKVSKDDVEGRVDYKTLRDKGHYDFVLQKISEMKGIWEHWSTSEREQFMLKLLKEHAPVAREDVVYIICEVDGVVDGRVETLRDERAIKAGESIGKLRNPKAIQTTTAAGICVVMDLALHNGLPQRRGFVRQEEIEYDKFRQSRYARYYEPSAS